MSDSLHLLTSCRHLRYTRALLSLGHRWDVAASEAAQREPWRLARQLPPNARLVDARTAQQRLDRGDYDAVICHGLDELDAAAHADAATVVVFHATAAGDRLYGLTTPDLRQRLSAALDSAERVFVARDVRQTWRLEGAIISTPAVDPFAGEAPTIGDDAAAVRLDNFDDERARLAGVEPLSDALRGLPCRVTTADAIRGGAVSRYRVFVTSPRAPYDSAVSSSMIDAMAAGLPVVSTAHTGSPVEHGRTGFIAVDTAELRGFVLELVGDRQLAQTMGARARAWALETLGEAQFERAWRQVLERGLERHDANRPPLRAAS